MSLKSIHFSPYSTLLCPPWTSYHRYWIIVTDALCLQASLSLMPFFHVSRWILYNPDLTMLLSCLKPVSVHESLGSFWKLLSSCGDSLKELQFSDFLLHIGDRVECLSFLVTDWVMDIESKMKRDKRKRDRARSRMLHCVCPAESSFWQGN